MKGCQTESEFLVSVSVITYNHEKYIHDAIEGVLLQKTDFKIELVIGDDYSTDNTYSICKEYAEKYTNQIKLLPSNINFGMTQNFIRTQKECNGKYVSICEGDDYWTDPYKLQNQVNFLEKNPEYGLVHTNYSILIEGKNEVSGKRLDNEDNLYHDITFSRLLLGNLIASLTVCFNKNIFRNLSQDFTKFKMVDYPLWLEFAYHSKIGFIDENTSVYRVQENSASNSKDKNIEFQFFKSIIEIVDYYSLKYNLPYKERQNIIFRHFENTLNVGYSRSNKLMTQFSYLSIKDQFSGKLTLNHKLLYYGNHRVTRILFKLLIKLYKKIKI